MRQKKTNNHLIFLLLENSNIHNYIYTFIKIFLWAITKKNIYLYI